MTRRLCISVTDEEAEFLESMQLSPSGLLKQRILEIKRDSTNYKNMIAERERAISVLQNKIFELNEIIERQAKTIEKNGIIQ